METSTAPAAPSAAPVVPVTPVAPAAPVSIESAGAAFKAATSWDDINLPVPVLDATDPEAPIAADPAAPVDAPEFLQNEHGQWHRPDGTFANADEITAITAQIAADAAAAPVIDSSAPVVEPIKPVTLRRRDGTTRDVQVDDPELAEEIRTNFNDGMRRKEFIEKSSAVEAKLAHFTQLDAAITKNPESFVLNSLTPDQQVNVATALLARHFDALVPIILGYDKDPGTRIKATADTEAKIRSQQTELDNFTASQQQAALVRGAVETLIPETAEPEIAQQFWADAAADLQRAVARGERVDPSTVPTLLSSRMKLYGFDAPAGSAPAKPSTPRIVALAPSSSPVAVPANDAAKLAQAKAIQTRIRLTQRNRANAAAVPPVGAGAAPVRLPPVPAGASIEDAAKAMKKHRSWTS